MPSNDIPAMEGTFSQDSADDISKEDMVDTHDIAMMQYWPR